MSPFERLAAWREAYQLALAVYRDTESFPKQERFGLTAQVRRAAISVPANIAEGCVKRGPAEFRRYLDIARGSLAELHWPGTLGTSSSQPGKSWSAASIGLAPSAGGSTIR